MPRMKQIACMKWGTLYDAGYVNRLYAMIARNITPPFRLVCYTDTTQGIRKEVETFPCPDIALPPPKHVWGWRKMMMWAEKVQGLEGTALYLDLDIVIVGNIDRFFEHKTKEPDGFCVMRNITRRNERDGNTSVFRWKIGSQPELLRELLAKPNEMVVEFNTDQEYLCARSKTIEFWPDGWCVAFKQQCVPPFPLNWLREPRLPTPAPGEDAAKIVVFTGSPRPHEAVLGQWKSPWFKRPFKRVKPAKWVIENWRE